MRALSAALRAALRSRLSSALARFARLSPLDILDTTLRESLDAEAMTVAVNAATEDMREAMRAFREKREPRFQGR